MNFRRAKHSLLQTTTLSLSHSLVSFCCSLSLQSYGTEEERTSRTSWNDRRRRMTRRWTNGANVYSSLRMCSWLLCMYGFIRPHDMTLYFTFSFCSSIWLCLIFSYKNENMYKIRIIIIIILFYRQPSLKVRCSWLLPGPRVTLTVNVHLSLFEWYSYKGISIIRLQVPRWCCWRRWCWWWWCLHTSNVLTIKM